MRLLRYEPPVPAGFPSRLSGFDAGRAVSPDARSELQATLGDAYTLERELGGGGMSRVWLATETALGRQVVVKVIAPELREGLSAERFTREVRLAARLQQANIVPLLSAGTSAGAPWYTMPFVSGESLRARLASGTPPSLTERISILRDVARALAYAHGEGVVHRDVKPENVMLAGAHAVLADFGVARALGGADELTDSGVAVGTRRYTSPEQAAGSRAVDAGTDIYSLGCVLYEMLAGPAAAEVLERRLVEPLPSVARARPDVPRWVDALVARVVLAGVGGRAVGRDDTSCEAGANSLLLVQLQRPLRETLQRVRPAVWLSLYPTGAALAQQLTGAATAGPGSPECAEDWPARPGAAPVRPARSGCGGSAHRAGASSACR